MEMEFGLCELTQNEEEGYKLNVLSELDIIPKTGIYLGLDISEESSGICLYKDGEKVSANISLVTKESEDFYEVKCRRELKDCLSELVSGLNIDVIVIEDVYQGVNPKTTRILYAINTAMDELILDGVCSCKRFIRVQNKVWKSWLFKLDTEHRFKGLEDKLRIQKCLELVGVVDSGEGFQDRLDSCGMLIGYFYFGKNEVIRSNKRVDFKDLAFLYMESEDFILEEVRSSNNLEELTIQRFSFGNKRISKKYIQDLVSENPDRVFISDSEIKLGNFMEVLNVDSISEEAGFLAFWVKPKRLKKYVEEM